MTQYSQPYKQGGAPANPDGVRMTAADGKVTAIPQQTINAISTGRDGVLTGFTGPWFAPQAPLNPLAPEKEKGRQFDYMAGYNLAYTPRGEQRENFVSFETLRRLAETAEGGLDILRLVIEKRKREMKTQRFQIVGRDKDDDGGPDARRIETMLRKPDGINSWRQWVGALLEDHFVIDAPTIYFRQSDDGMLFELIDGVTMKLLIDNNGRRPVPPLPAYQQIIKGVPAFDYTTEEVGYYADNVRANRVYGMSHVEQIIGMVSLALNRQLSVMNYYTSGSVPDMLMGVPATWTTSQIVEFQEYWDAILTGNIAARRGARFIPSDVKPYETKSEVLKNDFDEWLARIVCFAFSMSPMALVKEMNRATSETSKEADAESGLEPTKGFVKDVVDDILLRLDKPELELLWVDEEIIDAQTKSTVIMGQYGAARPIMTLAEARDQAGLPPATPEQLKELEPVPPPGMPGMLDGFDPFGEDYEISSEDDETDDEEQSQSDKVAKAARRSVRKGKKIPRARYGQRKIEAQIAAIFASHLKSQRRAAVRILRSKTEKLAKASINDDDIAAMIKELESKTLTPALRKKLQKLLQQMAQRAAKDSLAILSSGGMYGKEELQALLTQANEHAVEWARQRVSNLIVEVSDTTRRAVNLITADAISTGKTNQEIADDLEASFDFTDSRAIMIARTETAFADSEGTLIAFNEASDVLEGKASSGDNEACIICAGNEAAGTIPLDAAFPSGHQAPPFHPNCECRLIPVVDKSLIIE